IFSSKLDMEVQWMKKSIENWIETKAEAEYDLIVVANVLNELPEIVIERLLHQVSVRNAGVVLILEPGSSMGYQIIQTTAERISQKEQIIAPYINNSFVRSEEYWIHFPQK